MIDQDDLSAVIGSLPVALLTTDQKRKIVDANRAACKLFGYEENELIGRELELLMPHRFAVNHPAHYETFLKTPSTREMGAGRDLWALKKDGSEFPAEIGITVLDTTPPKYLASVLDITLRKETERLLREQKQQLEVTLEKEVAERTRLEERHHLGRELHDTLSQNLYGIGLGLRTAMAQIKKNADPADPLNYCLTLTEASLVEMRALLFRLRPQSLENVPLADVLQGHAQAVAARTKLMIDFKVEGNPKSELVFDKKYAIYRIVTEALHNCVKHAKAKSVAIALACGHGLVKASVKDDGKGFDTRATTAGHGLAGMRERAEAVGGTLRIDSGESGTLVEATVPRSELN